MDTATQERLDRGLEDSDYTVRAIIPNQFVGKWTNPQNISLRVFYYFDVDTRELKKCFLEAGVFTELKIKEIMKHRDPIAYGLAFMTDSEDRENLIAVKELGEYTIEIDN